jgi:hypothetical protein
MGLHEACLPLRRFRPALVTATAGFEIVKIRNWPQKGAEDAQRGLGFALFCDFLRPFSGARFVIDPT